jgi:hypothetical protein
VNEDIAQQGLHEASVIAGLYHEYIQCGIDTEHYATAEAVNKPHGMTWVEWCEQHRQVLEDDALMHVHRLYALATARVA